MRALSALAGLLLAAQAAFAAAPPVAAVRDVPQTFHGTVVHDPYRWLEDQKNPEVKAWMQGQGDAARALLDRIEGRDAIALRLAELARAQGDALRDIRLMPGERWYYLKRAPGEKQYRLVMRQGLAGAERVLVDPEIEARRSGVPHAINWYQPSWDGRYLAYGMSAGGSEDASLFLLDVAAGRAIGKPVPRVQADLVHWLPDSRALSYNQLAELAPGAPETDGYKDSRVMLMRIGAAPQPVFGPQVTKGLGLDRLDVAELITVPGSRWVVARTTDTTVPEGKLFVGALAQLGRKGMRWQRIAGEADKVVHVELQGDSLFVMTQAGTPRRKIVRVALDRGALRGDELARAELVVAQPAETPLEGFEATPTGLVVAVLHGTSRELRRYDRGDTAGRALPAPAAGAAWLIDTPAHHTDELAYSFTGWTEPTRWLRLLGDRSVEVPLGRRALPPGLPEVVVTEVKVPSHDGVLVPMTILHRRGLALDGSNPVLLDGYASYGHTISAHFSLDDMVWIERGGVVAYTNPRGSGVYGDEWHRAGFKATKPNTWKDGIACAKYLIDKGYGSAKTMGIEGGSAGGIFVGRAVTEAPQLFAAAIFNVGDLDSVRAELSANGATNISEFGTVADPAEFKALLEMSTYNAIKDGTAYPGVLLIHGLNDPRVEVWNSAKTAARLQAAQAGLPNAGPALLRLDAQAGHGIGSTLNQRQEMAADSQAFLLWRMGKAALKD